MTRKSCHERALGLLAVRARTRWEMDQRLRKAGFERAEIEEVLAGLERVGLIDDRAFAEQFAQHGFGVKGSGGRAVSRGLRAKGVSPELVAAVTQQGAGEEESRAEELAKVKVCRMQGLDPAKAFVRLNSLLIRRGYSPEVARWAARRALQIDQF